MKRVLLFTAILIVLLSCKVQKIQQHTINGNYYLHSKNKGFYTLQLNADSTFKFVAGIPWCTGKWELVDKTVILTCDEEDIYAPLSRGYMEKREHQLQVLSKNRLKYNDVILRQKK
jgi:hypothetical protein